MRSASCVVLCAAALASGCASWGPRDIVQPSEVTLENAMKSVGTGLQLMRDAQGEVKSGLIPTQVEVKFDLAASAKDAGKLTIDMTKDGAKTDISAGAEKSSEAEAKRGNTITITFKNILTLSKDDFAAIKSAKDIQQLVEVLRDQGIGTLGKANVVDK